MKKLIVTAVVALSLISGNIFAAGEDQVTMGAKEKFSKEFPGAEYAAWEKIAESDLFVVRFVYDNQSFVAYFTQPGEMVASARLITREILPYKVKQAINKKYSDGDIVKIEELTMDGESSYFFTIHSDEERLVFRVYRDGHAEKIKEEKIKSNDKKYAKR